MRARFVLNEVGIGLRRNLTLTIAAVITTAVSLALLGGGLLVRQQVSKLNSYYYGKLEVAVFLKANVTQDQRDQIRQALNGDVAVKTYTYESQQQAYEKFRAENANDKDLINNIGASALPESFRVQLKDPTQYDEARDRYSALSGVDSVYDYRQILDPIFRIFDGIKSVAYVIAGITVGAAALLIYNTVRVSAFGRRRETGIMRLVGASSFSIQLPFLVEGAVAGLLGGALACGALVAGKIYVVDGILSKRVSTNILPPLQWGDFEGAMPVLLLLGVGISVIASFVTLRRFLRV